MTSCHLTEICKLMAGNGFFTINSSQFDVNNLIKMECSIRNATIDDINELCLIENICWVC